MTTVFKAQIWKEWRSLWFEDNKFSIFFFKKIEIATDQILKAKYTDYRVSGNAEKYKEKN